MESGGETAVTRQATFETVRREQRKLDLPVIGSQDDNVHSVVSGQKTGPSVNSTKTKPKEINKLPNDTKSKLTPASTKTTTFKVDGQKDVRSGATQSGDKQSKPNVSVNTPKASAETSKPVETAKRNSNSNAKHPAGETGNLVTKTEDNSKAKVSALKNLNTKRNSSPQRRNSSPKKDVNAVHVDNSINSKGPSISGAPTDAKKPGDSAHNKPNKALSGRSNHFGEQNVNTKHEKSNDSTTVSATSTTTTTKHIDSNKERDKEGNQTKRAYNKQNDDTKAVQSNVLPINRAPVGTTLVTNKDGNSDAADEATKTVAIDETTNLPYVRSPSPKVNKQNTTPSPQLQDRPSETKHTSQDNSNPVSSERKMDGRESYQQLYAERNTLLNAEIAYKKRIKQLEDEANGFLQAIEELTNENKALRGRLDKLDANSVKVEGEQILIGNKRGNSGDTQSRHIELLQQEIRELKAQIIRLQTDNQAINEENVKLKAENYENVKKLHALETEAKSLAKSVTAVESEKLDKLNDLTNDHTNLKKEVKDLKAKNKELEDKVNALEYENTSLSETLTQKKSELSELLVVMKDENKFDNEIKDLKTQVMKLQKEKRELELSSLAEKRRLEDEIEDLKPKLEETTKQLDEKKIKADELEAENLNIKSDCDTLTATVSTQKTEIEELKAEIERLKQELASMKALYDKLLSETESAHSDLAQSKTDLESFNKELQAVVSDKEIQISKLVSQLDALKKEKEAEKSKTEKEIENSKHEIKRLKVFENNMSRMESEIKHLVDRLDESELKKKQLAINLEDKGFQVSNLEQQVFEMNMKIDGASQRMSQLDRDKREMEKDKREWEVKRDKFNDIEASNKRLLEENKRLRSQLELTSQAKDYRPTEPIIPTEKPILDAWVSDKNPNQASQHAIYVQKEKDRKKVQISTQPTQQKKRVPYSKSSPVKSTKTKRDVVRVTLTSSRSLEDMTKSPDPRRTPESEISLPELQRDAKLTGGYGMSGYREIHRNRIRAASKKVF